jgi:hypothetical protein
LNLQGLYLSQNLGFFQPLFTEVFSKHYILHLTYLWLLWRDPHNHEPPQPFMVIQQVKKLLLCFHSFFSVVWLDEFSFIIFIQVNPVSF